MEWDRKDNNRHRNTNMIVNMATDMQGKIHD